MADSPNGVVTYIFPAWGLVPQVKHKFHGIHAHVQFDDSSGPAPDIVHNLELMYGAPAQPPEWVYPLVIVNPIQAGPAAPQHVLGIKNGNTISIQRAASGPGTAVTYDVWVLRPVLKGGWFD
jgi:hypothetical protein